MDTKEQPRSGTTGAEVAQIEDRQHHITVLRASVSASTETIERLINRNCGMQKEISRLAALSEQLLAALVVLTDAVETRRPEHEGYLSKCAQDARAVIAKTTGSAS